MKMDMFQSGNQIITIGIIEKNRSGPWNGFELNFMKEFNKFTNLVPDRNW